MSAVDPANSRLLNPMVRDSPWRGSDGQRAVIDAWGSAVWDDVNRDLWVPIGGGHGNYGGNEPYKADLGSATPQWRVMRAPSGAVGNTINLHDSQEDTGIHADGRPRAVHVYNNVAFATGVGPVIVRLASTFPGSGGSHKVFKVDPQSGETSLVFDFSNAASVGFANGFPGGTGAGNTINGASCYDPRRNRICSVGTGNNTYLMYCTPALTPGMWRGGCLPTTVYLSEGPQALIYLPTQDRYMSLATSQGMIVARLVHPATGVTTDIALSGAFASGLNLGTMPGVSWSSELGKVLMWNQSANTPQISTLTPVGNGLGQWNRGSLTVAAENTLVPPTSAHNGTFGLFGYSSSLKGCYLITSTTAPVHFFATQ